MSTLLDAHLLFFDPGGRLARRVAVHAGRPPTSIALLPGRYRVTLAYGSGTRHTLSRDVVVERDALREMEPVLRLVRGRLRFVDDASGQPIRSERLLLASRPDPSTLHDEAVAIETDAAGECEPELLSDHWLVHGERTGAARAPTVRGAFDWPSAAEGIHVVRLGR